MLGSWGEENPNFLEYALERSACSCLLVLGLTSKIAVGAGIYGII